MSKRTWVAVVLTTAVIGLSSVGSEAAKNFSRYYVEAQKSKPAETAKPRSATAERNRPAVPRKPIVTILPQVVVPEDVAATEPPKRAAKPQRQARAAVETVTVEPPAARPIERPHTDVAPRPNIPDVAFEPPAARQATPPPKPVAKPERLARLVPPSEAAQDVDRKAAVVMRPQIDLAPRPDVPDIPFAVPAIPSVPKANDSARGVDAADLPKPLARPQSKAMVAVDAKPDATGPAFPSVPERLEIDRAPSPDVPDIAFAPPPPKSTARQASPERAPRKPASATASVVSPAVTAPDAQEAPTVETKARTAPTPPRKLPHVARIVEEPAPNKPNIEPQRQASVEPDAMPIEALTEPVLSRERKARPELDMAPRPDTPDTVFIIPDVVARDPAALDSIARHTGSVTRKPKPEADIARSGTPAAGQELPRQDEAALDVPSVTSKPATGSEAGASTTPATTEESACEKAKRALAGDAFTDLQAKKCTGIVFTFVGEQRGKTYSIKFGPLTGEYIAIQQASSTSTGLSLDVLRGKVDEVSKSE